MMTNEYLIAAAGGALIGLGSVVLLWLNGRIAGISGIMNAAVGLDWCQSGWRIAFIAGLILGGVLFQWVTGDALIARTDFPLWMTIAGGLLVGFGTRLGSGCTSGHGICGLSRLSIRSLVATATFVVVGMIVATSLSRWLL